MFVKQIWRSLKLFLRPHSTHQKDKYQNNMLLVCLIIWNKQTAMKLDNNFKQNKGLDIQKLDTTVDF